MTFRDFKTICTKTNTYIIIAVFADINTSITGLKYTETRISHCMYLLRYNWLACSSPRLPFFLIFRKGVYVFLFPVSETSLTAMTSQIWWTVALPLPWTVSLVSMDASHQVPLPCAHSGSSEYIEPGLLQWVILHSPSPFWDLKSSATWVLWLEHLPAKTKAIKLLCTLFFFISR